MSQQRQLGEHEHVQFYSSQRPPSRRERAHPHWLYFVRDGNKRLSNSPHDVFEHNLDPGVSLARIVSFNRIAVKRRFQTKRRRRRTRRQRLSALTLQRVPGLTESYIIPFDMAGRDEERKHHIDFAQEVMRHRITQMLSETPVDVREAFLALIMHESFLLDLLIAGGTIEFQRLDIPYYKKLAINMLKNVLKRKSLLAAKLQTDRKAPRKPNRVRTTWNSGSINLKKFNSLEAPEQVTDPIDAVLIPRLTDPTIFGECFSDHVLSAHEEMNKKKP